ncbi:hypothetical protein N185_17615 [Sinorhizobium sp. GW3]|nr:hypothetical protein N185_17615 [Sinorhizobium sp. GW3]
MSGKIDNVAALTALGRVRLSENFFMREMLYSEVGNLYGVPNIPEDPDVAVKIGSRLAQEVLEPLRKAFGHISIRSAYRSPTLNNYCYERFKSGDTACWCISNQDNAAQHIWDWRDEAGFFGATATVVIPGYIPYYEKTGDRTPLAWWIKDNIPDYAEVFFFRHLCAFNIRWYEGPSDKAIWYLDPPQRELILRSGQPDFEGNHSHLYEKIIPNPLPKKGEVACSN